MPSFTWVGKPAVENHDRRVPYRLLKCDKAASHGDVEGPNTGHLLVEGDNLEALKALLPYYRGQVKCAYIDPPYNTGNEGWVYNDNVNSPEIRRWLGKVVGKEAEDLNRHDKWLCMMYPRLKLLREFLADDGVLFVSIDDDEVASLRMVLDDLFGRRGFIANVVWQKRYVSNMTARWLSDMHDHVLIYSPDPDRVKVNKLPRSDEQLKAYKNPDNDPRGRWRAQDLSASKPYEAGKFTIIGPTDREFNPPPNRYWRCNRETFERWRGDNRIWWGKAKTARPMLKAFLAETEDGVTPNTWWTYEEFGHNKEATLELKEVFGGAAPFDTPKPVRLIEKLATVFAGKDALFLDSFAGSGTTGHAVLKMNAADGGSRRCLLVEMDHDIASNVAAERLRRVIDGYGTGERLTPGTGGGFRYCTLGDTLTDEDGLVRESVTFSDLAHHVYFKETGRPLPRRPAKLCPYIGEYEGTAYFLLFNGVLGDRRPDGGNVLTGKVLDRLKVECDDAWKRASRRVIYGEANRLAGSSRLRDEHVQFQQIPYDLNREG